MKAGVNWLDPNLSLFLLQYTVVETSAQFSQSSCCCLSLGSLESPSSGHSSLTGRACKPIWDLHPGLLILQDLPPHIPLLCQF